MATVHELDVLTHSERQYLADLFARWVSARSNKSWLEADALREQLVSAGVDLVNEEWHTIYESKESRYARFKARERV